MHTWSIRILIIFFTLFTFILPMTGYPQDDVKVISEQRYYDKEGRLIREISADGSQTTYQYNEQDLLAEVKYPDGQIKYGYDEHGNQIWIKDETGITEYYYDALDRLVGVIWKHSPWRLIHYGYDSRDNLTRIAIFDLQAMQRESKYEPILNELERDISDGTQSWRYREKLFNQMMHQLNRETLQIKQQWLQYEVKYKHNLLGNITQIDTNAGSIKYSYHFNRGVIERQLPNGITTRFTYSPNGLLKSLRHESNVGKLIAEYRYDYNAAGKVINVHELTPNISRDIGYTWDTRGLLTEVRLPNQTRIRYDYDAVGNIISETTPTGKIDYIYDRFGRPAHVGNIMEYKWDLNDNLTSLIDKQINQQIKIQYNGRNLPNLVKTHNSEIRYKWDAQGNLVYRETHAETTHYLPHSLAPPDFTLAEFDNAGKLTRSYIYGDRLLGQQDRLGRPQFFLEDGFNTVRHITDMDGKTMGQMKENSRITGEGFLSEVISPYSKDLLKKSISIGGKILRNQFPPRWVDPKGQLAFDFAKQFDQSGQLMRYDYGLRWVPRHLPRWVDSKGQLAFDFAKRFDRAGQLRPYYYTQYDRFRWGKYLPRTGRALGTISDAWTYFNAFQSGWKAGGALLQGQPTLASVHAIKPFVSYGVGILFTKLAALAAATGGTGWGFAVVIPAALVSYDISLGWNIFEALATKRDLNRQTERHRRQLVENLYSQGRSKQEIWEALGTTGVPEAKRDKYLDGLKFDDDDGSGYRGSGFGGELKDPFKSIENQLGGIELSATATFDGIRGEITGAVFDSEQGVLVLLSDLSGETAEEISVSINPQDVAVALLCVFKEHPQDPQFSLNPADPKHPDGEWLKAVYIPEEVLAGTAAGDLLFQGDWILKQLSFGVRIDENGQVVEREVSVPGFKSLPDLAFEKEGDYDQKTWARIWIVLKEVEGSVLREVDSYRLYNTQTASPNIILRLATDRKAMIFDSVVMEVKARKQVVDPNSPTGLRDVDTCEDAIATAFSELMTRLYDEIAAKEVPEFARLKELAKAVATCKWIKEQKIPINIDEDWVLEHAKGGKYVNKVHTLHVPYQRTYQEPYSQGGQRGIREITRTLRLFGGIDLKVIPGYIKDGSPRSVREAVRSKLKRVRQPRFTVEHNRRILQATVLPINKNGQEIWNSQSVEINGIVYYFDSMGRVNKSVDGHGNTAEYGYDFQGRLKTVEISNRNGWKLSGQRNADGSSLWEMTNPRQHLFSYHYNNSGYLTEVQVDGDTLANYEYTPDQRKAVIRYADYTETRRFDVAGRLTKYEIQLDQEERLVFQFNQLGNLTQIHGSGVSSVNISYTDDGVRPLQIITRQSRIQYVYDSEERIKETRDTINNTSEIYTYSGNLLITWQFNAKDKHAEFKFNANGEIAKIRNLLGGQVDYIYNTDGQLISIQNQYGKVDFDYNEDRLEEIQLPDSSRITYNYRMTPGQSLNQPTYLIETTRYPRLAYKPNKRAAEKE